MVYTAYKFQRFPDRITPLLGGNTIFWGEEPTDPTDPTDPGPTDPTPTDPTPTDPSMPIDITSIPTGWVKYYARDFTKPNATDDANWVATNGTAGNHAGIMRPANVIKSGPNGQELITTMATSTSPIYTGAVQNHALSVQAPNWYVRVKFRTVDLRRGFWPSLWMRPNSSPGAVAPGEGEPDMIEVFGGHMVVDKNGTPTGAVTSGYTKIAGTTFITTPYATKIVNSKSLDAAVPAYEWDNWHIFEWFKTPYKCECYVNGKLALTVTAPASGDARQRWIDQFEDPKKRWYIRLDAQAGTVPGHIEAGDFQAPWPVDSRQQMQYMVVAHKP